MKEPTKEQGRILADLERRRDISYGLFAKLGYATFLQAARDYESRRVFLIKEWGL